MKPTPATNIVFLGFDLACYHAYKRLSQGIKRDIQKGKTRIVIIHSGEDFHFDGWGTEITTEIIQPKNTCYSLKKLVPEANLVIGQINGLDQESHQVNVSAPGKTPFFIHYNHLILSQQANQYVNEGHWLLASNPNRQKEINYSLQHLVMRAAGAKNIWEARKLFQLVITGNLASSREWAVQISEYLSQLSLDYPSLHGIQPGISLVGKWHNRFSSAKYSSPSIEKYVQKQLNQYGIQCFEDQEVIRENADGVVLTDGSFIACHWVFNCEETSIWPAGLADFKKNDDHSFTTDKYSRLLGQSNIWAANKQAKTSPQYEGRAVSFQVEDVKKGRHLGQNILNALTCQMLRPYQTSATLQVGSLGSGKGLVKWGNWALTGTMAQWLRLFLLLKAMPTRQSALACMGDWISFFIWNRQKATLEQINTIPEKKGYRQAIQTAV